MELDKRYLIIPITVEYYDSNTGFLTNLINQRGDLLISVVPFFFTVVGND